MIKYESLFSISIILVILIEYQKNNYILSQIFIKTFTLRAKSTDIKNMDTQEQWLETKASLMFLHKGTSSGTVVLNEDVFGLEVEGNGGPLHYAIFSIPKPYSP